VTSEQIKEAKGADIAAGKQFRQPLAYYEDDLGQDIDEIEEDDEP